MRRLLRVRERRVARRQPDPAVHGALEPPVGGGGGRQGPAERDPRPGVGLHELAEGKRRAADRRPLRLLHGRGARRGAGPRADPSPPRRDRRSHRHGRGPEGDRPPARAGHSRALRPHRLVGQPAADAGRRRRLRLGPRAARPRLLREERAAFPGGAREVPRPRGARDRAGRGEPRGFPTGGGRRLRHGEAARGGVARQRGAARPEGHRPQDHLRRADEPRPGLRLAGVLRRREAPACRPSTCSSPGS